MFGFFSEDGFTPMSGWLSWVLLIVVVSICVVLYFLRACALNKLAKNCGDNKISNIAYLSFIPFMWVYVLACLAGRINFFGNQIKKLPLILLLVYSVGKILMIIDNVLIYGPIGFYFLKGNIVCFNLTDYTTNFTYIFDSNIMLEYSLIPFKNIDAINMFLLIIEAVSGILSFLSDIVLIFVFIAFFKKFWPDHYFAGTILSIFGFFPIVVFIIRKRTAIDYEAFIRERFESMYNVNNNQNNYYGQNSSQNYSQGSHLNDDPFDSFGNDNDKETEDDPFSEFDKKN